jgi:hypothetical protein
VAPGACAAAGATTAAPEFAFTVAQDGHGSRAHLLEQAYEPQALSDLRLRERDKPGLLAAPFVQIAVPYLCRRMLRVKLVTRGLRFGLNWQALLSD